MTFLISNFFPDILDAMFNGIGLQGVDPNSSRHFANIPGSALPSASIADYYASTINKFPGIYKFAPGERLNE